MTEIFPAATPDVASDMAAEVGDLLHEVSRRIRRAASVELEPLGLTGAQARALRTLARCGAPIRMSGLAEQLRIARRSATSVVDDLVGKGLVARHGDPSDRRAITVDVTTAGRRVLRRLDDRRHAVVADATAGMSAADLATLRDLLRRLA